MVDALYGSVPAGVKAQSICWTFFLSFRSEAEESAFRIGYTAGVATREWHFYVYILSSRSRTLYIGVTNDLRARVIQHREDWSGSFTAKYKIHRLVYFEHFKYVRDAIAREKELKDWNRVKKIALIKSANATWEDLAADL